MTRVQLEGEIDRLFGEIRDGRNKFRILRVGKTYSLTIYKRLYELMLAQGFKRGDRLLLTIEKVGDGIGEEDITNKSVAMDNGEENATQSIPEGNGSVSREV